MNDVQHNDALAFSARVLGALFYFAPNSTLAEPLVAAFTDDKRPLVLRYSPRLTPGTYSNTREAPNKPLKNLVARQN